MKIELLKKPKESPFLTDRQLEVGDVLEASAKRAASLIEKRYAKALPGSDQRKPVTKIVG